MEKVLIAKIRENILASNPKTFNKGISVCRKLINGKVLEWVSEEGIKAGLTDNLTNYFYIRYRDEPQVDEPEDRTTSCEEYEMSVPLRLVAWVNNGNEAKLVEVLIYDIAHTDFTLTGYDARLVTKLYPIKIEEIIKDRERIYTEETNQDPEKIKLKKYATLVAIDFTLRFNHKPYVHSECINRTICEVC